MQNNHTYVKSSRQVDYHPFGMIMTDREWSQYVGDRYRFGFGGHEKEDEIAGEGNLNFTFFRILDNRLGRWYSIDPANYIGTPYCSMNNNPVLFIDPYGDTTIFIDTKGNLLWKNNDALPTAVTVIGDKGTSKLMLAIKQDVQNKRLNAISDASAKKLRKTGISYMVNTYFEYYDKHEKDYYTGDDWEALPGEPPLASEAGSRMCIVEGEMRLQGKEAEGIEERGPRTTILSQGDGDGLAHTHPNAGRRGYQVRGGLKFLINFQKGKDGFKLDFDTTEQEAGGQKLDVGIEKNTIYFYNKAGVLFAYSRGGF